MTTLTLTRIKISVQRLDKQMDLLQDNQLIHALGDSHDEIQRRISSVDELVGSLFDNIAHFRGAGQDVAGNFAENASLVRVGILSKEFRESDLALATDQDNKIPAY